MNRRGCAARLFAYSVWLLLAWPLLADPGSPMPYPTVIQLKWHNQFQFAGYYAAEQLGYFREAGLNVSLRPGGKGINPVEEVLSGRAQFGIGDSDLLLARAQGKPLVVLAAIFQHSPYIVLTRKIDHLSRPSDLVGKTIMAMGDQGSAQIRGMLLNEGIDPGKVRFVPHSWNLDDLMSGRVDGMSAYSTVEPHQLAERGVPPGILRPADYGIDFYGDCLFTTEAEVRNHPAEIEALLQALRSGWQVAMDDPQKVIPWILQLPDVQKAGLTQADLEYEARAMKPLVLSNIIQVGHMNPHRWRQILAAYKRLDLVPSSMKLDGFLYSPPPTEPPISHIPRWLWLTLAALGGLVLLASLWVLALRRAVHSRTLALQREHNQLRMMQHSVDQAEDFMTWVGENGSFLYANHAALDLYGLSLQDLQSRTVWELTPGMDEAGWNQTWSNLGTRRVISQDLDLLTSNGRWVPVEILSTLVDLGDRRVCCTIARDLTDFRKAEQDRKEHEQQLSLVLEATGVSIWNWHLPSDTLQMDPTIERLLGYGPWEIPRFMSAWRKLIHPDDRERVNRAMEPILDGSAAPYDLDVRLLRKDGTWVWTHARGRTAEFSSKGKPIRILGLLQDIDQRKSAEEDQRQSQRLEGLGLLAGGIAHDFNNLLTAVMGNLNLAKLKLEPDSREGAYIQKAESAIQQAARLTHQLLAYSGKGRLLLGAINLNEVVVQMRDLVAISLSKDLRIETRLAPESPFLDGDATQVQQVVLNLLTNASEAIGDVPGFICLETSIERWVESKRLDFPNTPLPSGQYAMLSVSDSGSGMTPEVKKRIFDPFYTTKATGRGLGLSAIQGIMRGHRGGIDLQSVPGEGTTFKLYFPLHAGTPQPQRSTVAPSRQKLDGSVLLADDEPGVLEAGQDLLESLGFTVITAEDGEVAITRLLESLGEIRLVILDQTMPRMSGTDCFRAIRRVQPGLPVILSSGYSEEEVGEVLREEGLDGFLQKPYRLVDLEAIVRKVLEP